MKDIYDKEKTMGMWDALEDKEVLVPQDEVEEISEHEKQDK